MLQLNGKIKRENYGKRKKNGEDPEKEQKGKIDGEKLIQN